MSTSLDLEAAGISTDHQGSVVYGYPVHSPATSTPGYLLWTRTSSTSSSSSLVNPAAPPPPRNNLRKLFLPLIFLASGIGIIAVIVWYAAVQELNTDWIPEFEVNSISFSPLISTDTRKSTANWTIGVSAKNTNRHTRVILDEFQVSVYYKAEKLSSARVSTLFLGPKNRTTVVASLQRKEKKLTAAEIDEDRIRNGNVKFDVVLQLKMTYLFHFRAIVGGRKKVENMELLCSDVKVGFSSSEKGEMIGDSYWCNSDLAVDN